MSNFCPVCLANGEKVKMRITNKNKTGSGAHRSSGEKCRKCGYKTR